LALREYQALLKSAGLLTQSHGGSQSQPFNNEDFTQLFRLSHHASTSISANQKPLDAQDLSYSEFLEFLCRLALATNFKLLGDGNIVARLQQLCSVSE
jgi:hypothetical protein